MIPMSLVGRLVGLVRAAEGNEDLVDAGTMELIREALANEDDSRIADLEARIAAEKRRLAPDCITCAVKCGRTDDWDPSSLDGEGDEVRALKLSLIEHLVGNAKVMTDDDVLRALYHIGLAGLEPQDLEPFFG